MSHDWDARYEAALEEITAARLQWNEAEAAMARANARRDRAERAFHQVFLEKMDSISIHGAQ